MAYADTEEKPADTGQKGYRLPGEPKDARPLIWMRPFWKTPEEKAAYTDAVRENPRECDPVAGTIESPMAYIQRLAAIVAGKPLPEPVRPMPTTTQGLTFEDRVPGEDDE